MNKKAARLDERQKDLVVLAILFSIAAAIAFYYFFAVDYPNLKGRMDLHSQILSKQAQSPYQYRVLVPFLTDVLIQAAPLESYPYTFLVAYSLYDIAAIFLILAMLFIYLRIWFTREQSLIGALFIAGTMTIALRNHYYQPWSLLEAGLFTLALLLIYKKEYPLIGIVVAVASLNRETAIFIPVVFLCASIDLKHVLAGKIQALKEPLGWGLAYFAIWAVVYWGLRMLMGPATAAEIPQELWSRNIDPGSLAMTYKVVALMFGFFWLFAALGYKHAPGFVKRTVLVVPFYLLSILIYGVWYEVRLFMPLYPIVMSLGLSFVYPDQVIDEKPHLKQISTQREQAVSNEEPIPSLVDHDT